MVARVDNITRYIQDKLIANNLKNRVNVIHLSDHGMIGVTPPKFIDLTKFIHKKYFKMYGSSPVIQIVPKKTSKSKSVLNYNMYSIVYFNWNIIGMENEIFIKLTKAAENNGNFKMYNQNNLPERWHANNRRLGPILAVADVEYGFQDLMDEAIKYEKLYNVTSMLFDMDL